MPESFPTFPSEGGSSIVVIGQSVPEVCVKMKFKNELLFRKAFIPWYDTEPAMYLTLAFSLAVLLFSITGVAAALDTQRYHAFIWVPCLLGLLSLGITISTLIRLIRRGSNGSA
jgi:hypothetical protein